MEGSPDMIFTSLAQFYNSEAWRSFRLSLMSERVSSDGILYDEYNHQPLLKAWDVVAHHKIPLTMSNVNDFSISLNPENIMLVSHRSHNEIHARYGYSMNKKVYYVYGCYCSGKSTFVRNAKGNSDLIIDIDLIWQAVTGGELYYKPDALKTQVFQIRDLLLQQAKTRMGKWERCYIIEGGARKAERERKIEMLGAEPIFIESTLEECMERLLNDEQRRDYVTQWKTYIEKWFEEYQE